MAIGNEFRWEGRTAGKGNTLSDLGIDRCSVGLFVRAFVCAFPQRIGHGQRQRRAFWPFRYSQGRVRGKSWKVKAGAREGEGEQDNVSIFAPSFPLPRPSFLRVKYWDTVTSEGGEFRSASVLLSGFRERRPRSSTEVYSLPPSAKFARQLDSECGHVALNCPRRLSPISNSIGSLDWRRQGNTWSTARIAYLYSYVKRMRKSTRSDPFKMRAGYYLN